MRAKYRYRPQFIVNVKVIKARWVTKAGTFEEAGIFEKARNEKISGAALVGYLVTRAGYDVLNLLIEISQLRKELRRLRKMLMAGEKR